jgi:hypothetical protein
MTAAESKVAAASLEVTTAVLEVKAVVTALAVAFMRMPK